MKYLSLILLICLNGCTIKSTDFDAAQFNHYIAADVKYVDIRFPQNTSPKGDCVYRVSNQDDIEFLRQELKTIEEVLKKYENEFTIKVEEEGN